MERVRAVSWFRLVGPTCWLAAFGVPGLAAQTDGFDPRPGDLIRIQVTGGRATWRTGALVAGNSDSVRFVDAKSTDTTAVAVSDLRRWEVSRGTSRGTGRGALRGFFYGALTSGILAGLVPNPEASGLSASGFHGAVAAGGGVLGAGIGALIGAGHHRWAPVLRPLRAEQDGGTSEVFTRTGFGIAAAF